MKNLTSKTFHERICTARRNAGITQEDMAERIGVSRTTIAKWESGKAEPNLLHLVCIAQILQVSTDTLLGVHIVPTSPVEGLSQDAVSALEIFLREVKKDAK